MKVPVLQIISQHTKTNLYRRLIVHAQLLRRSAELHSCEYGGIASIRASLYKHQLGAAQQVLMAPRIRHLLTDEVGLGKTLEALMILQARLIENPSCQIGILVPKHLVAQWKEELRLRLPAQHQKQICVFTEDTIVNDILRHFNFPTSKKNDDRRLRSSRSGLRTGLLPIQFLVIDEFHALDSGLRKRIVEEKYLLQRPHQDAAVQVYTEQPERKSFSDVLLAWDKPAWMEDDFISLQEFQDGDALLHELCEARGKIYIELADFERLSGAQKEALQRRGNQLSQLLFLTASPPINDKQKLAELKSFLLPELYQRFQRRGRNRGP